jgi:hypothetical protein
VKLCNEEPHALVALVRVCEGWGQRCPRLLGGILSWEMENAPADLLISAAQGVTASKSWEALNCAERSTVAEQAEGTSAARAATPMTTTAAVKITCTCVIP